MRQNIQGVREMTYEPAAAQRQPSSPALWRAGDALWLATLSLMTAYMHTGAPAHRYLLASRIARNFSTLRDQECFDDCTRASFSRLARRWESKADALSPTGPSRRGALARVRRFLFH
jgi:hypothetical protein